MNKRMEYTFIVMGLLALSSLVGTVPGFFLPLELAEDTFVFYASVLVIFGESVKCEFGHRSHGRGRWRVHQESGQQLFSSFSRSFRKRRWRTGISMYF